METKYTEGLSLDIAPETIDYQVETAVSLLGDLTADSPDVRLRASQKIKQIAYNVKKMLDKKVVRSLLEALTAYDDEGFQIDIIVTIGFIGEATALPFLRKILIESSNYELKMAAAFALGEMRFAGSSGALIEALLFDDEQLQLLIIDALIKIGDKNTAPAAIEASKNSSVKVKFAACGFLCKLGVMQGYEFIKRGITHESDAVKKDALMIACEYPHEILL